MDITYRCFPVICGVLSLRALMIYGQPSACNDDVECSSGFYCEKVVHACHECVRCEELKRESPVPQEVCVKSVVECGACLKGFVEDLRLDRACSLPSERSNGDGSVPPYAWLFIALLLLIFTAIIIYIVLKRKTLFSYIFKIRASTHASVHSRGTNNGIVSAPSSHDPPPPYNPFYEPVRPVSPSDPNEIILSEDSSLPFIKRTPAAPTQRGRDSAGNQAARPFNNPAYVRGPTAGIGNVEDSDPGSPFPPHDEDTMESHWTPNNNVSENTTDGGVSQSSGDVAGALVTRPSTTVARRPAADAEPPSKVARLREDTNNNRGHESSGGSGSGSPRASSPSPSPPPGPPHSVIINVVTNINKVEQRNSVNH